MFPALVDGELPAPFCLEKYNFNPFEILGSHTYADGKNALSLSGADSQKRKCNP